MFSLHKMATSLIPFPRLHFFTPHYLQSFGSVDPFTQQDTLALDLFDPSHCFLDLTLSQGRSYTYYCGMRTASPLVSELSLHTQLSRYHKTHSSHFYEWIPDNKQVSFLRMKENNACRS
jgi:hypothetical protein